MRNGHQDGALKYIHQLFGEEPSPDYRTPGSWNFTFATVTSWPSRLWCSAMGQWSRPSAGRGRRRQ